MSLNIADYVDFNQRSFWVAAAAILFNPTFWNTAARSEYNFKVISRTVGNPYYGCYLLGLTIFILGLVRDFLYERALQDQPTLAILQTPPVTLLSTALFLTGNVLVLSSMYALGITGTYLGDYFGILMDAPVTGFPFSVTGAPMYYGSALSFLAGALWFGKPAGVLLTMEVLLVYLVALRFEDPFTSEIYAKRERERKAAKSSVNGGAKSKVATRSSPRKKAQ